MGFSEENLTAVKNLITERRTKAEADARARLLKAYEKAPELKELDAHFPLIGQAIINAFSDPKSAEKTINELRKESEALKAARAECLESVGLPSDYTSPHYFCEKCEDTGYLEYKMCDCMRKELVKMSFKSSGLGSLIGTQSFDNFSLDYYSGDDRLTMEMNVEIAKNFVRDFGQGSPSLLLMGGTGLGKTHISTAIAAGVIEKGYDVLYETSQNIISDFSFERFGRGFGDQSENKTERYFDCDLLIIDDFGTEETNQFSVACFYNLINTRQNKSLPTIINTNILHDAIAKRYTERIASRLFGEFTVLSFTGRDIRMQKLMQ